MRTDEATFHIQRNFEYLLESIGRQRFREKTQADESGVRCLTGLPHPLANLVIIRQQELSGFSRFVEELETWSLKAGAPVSLLLFPGEGREACILEALKRKWIQILSMPGMWLTIHEESAPGPDAEGVEIRLVKSPEDLALVCRVLAEGYPVPENVADFFMRGIDASGGSPDHGLANLLVTVDGEPAACSSACVHSGVVGVYCVATLEAFRRRGLGGLATRAALNHGRQLGATHALLHASDQGESVYRRIGFTEDCRVSVLSFGM